MSIDPQKVSDVIVECAEKYILPRYQNLLEHQISTKTGPGDLVTHADLDVEAHLSRVLPGMLPGSVVLGEEGVSKGETSPDLLKDASRAVWVVDPVDGTHNFVKGKREFAVMLALVENGETRFSWIYDVLGKEMAVAEKGAGATMAGRVLKVANGEEALTGFLNARFFPGKFQEHLELAAQSVTLQRPLFCAAHEYLALARGDVNFSVYSRTKPWDHLAGALLVQEAGGYAARWTGQPYRPGDEDHGLVVADSEKTWKKIFELFIKKLAQ